MTTKPKVKKRTLGNYFDDFFKVLPKDAPNIKPPTIAVSAYIKRLQSSGVEFHVAPGYFETGGRA